MPQRIVIEGDVVRVIEETEVRVAALKDLMPHLERRLPVSVGPLPLGTLFLSYDKDGKRFSIAIERPPILQTIRVHYKTNNGARDDTTRDRDNLGNASFTLPLPYSIWTFAGKIDNNNYLSVDSGSYWWSPRHIAAPEDELYAAIMPNIFAGGDICWGGTGATGNGFDRLGTLVNEFLTTEFNDHLAPRFPPPYQSYTEWEAAGKVDPNCWRNWDWARYDKATLKAQLAPDKPLANYNFDFVIPAPPPSFTLERARDWIRRIPERDRSVMLAAIVAEAK